MCGNEMPRRKGIENGNISAINAAAIISTTATSATSATSAIATTTAKATRTRRAKKDVINNNSSSSNANINNSNNNNNNSNANNSSNGANLEGKIDMLPNAAIYDNQSNAGLSVMHNGGANILNMNIHDDLPSNLHAHHIYNHHHAHAHPSHPPPPPHHHHQQHHQQQQHHHAGPHQPSSNMNMTAAQQQQASLSEYYQSMAPAYQQQVHNNASQFMEADAPNSPYIGQAPQHMSAAAGQPPPPPPPSQHNHVIMRLLIVLPLTWPCITSNIFKLFSVFVIYFLICLLLEKIHCKSKNSLYFLLNLYF